MNVRIIFLLSVFFLLSAKIAYTCSRFTYTSPENIVVTGRSMDWMEDPQTELWAFPAGLTKVGGNAENSVTWRQHHCKCL